MSCGDTAMYKALQIGGAVNASAMFFRRLLRLSQFMCAQFELVSTRNSRFDRQETGRRGDNSKKPMRI